MTDGAPPIRLAVIGTGAISQVVHVPILAEREDVDLVALADTDAPKADTIAHRFDVAEVIEPEEALTRDDLDGVVLCTPNDTHEEMALQALEAGKHVFVERPIATSPVGAARVIEAVKTAEYLPVGRASAPVPPGGRCAAKFRRWRRVGGAICGARGVGSRAACRSCARHGARTRPHPAGAR